MKSMDSIRSTASTRRRRKKAKKRKSLNGMFGDEGSDISVQAETVKKDAAAERKADEVERVLVNETAGESKGHWQDTRFEEAVKLQPKQESSREGLFVEVEDGPTVEVALKKSDQVEIGLDLGPKDTMVVNVDINPAPSPHYAGKQDIVERTLNDDESQEAVEADYQEFTTGGNAPFTPPLPTEAQPAEKKHRLRRLMGKAIKIQRGDSYGASSETSDIEGGSLESAVTAGTSGQPPPSPGASESKLPRFARKSRVPKLGKLSDELSLWMKADKKIKEPTQLPSKFSQSMPALPVIPSAGSSSRISGVGELGRQSMDSELESPIERTVTTDGTSARRPTRIPSFSQLPRIKRTMTEPAIPRQELPMKHYPATTDDISSYQSRAPLRPSDTIRLVEPDPEDVAAQQAAKTKTQASPITSRFGFRRTSSQSSLTSGSFRDSVDETRPSTSQLPTPGGTRLVSASTPALGNLPDTSPSGSTISLGLFRAKTWGFDKEKSKEKEKERKEKKEKKDKDKKDKDKDKKKVNF